MISYVEIHVFWTIDDSGLVGDPIIELPLPRPLGCSDSDIEIQSGSV